MKAIPTVKEFFKKYSDNTSLTEGYYAYLVEKESFEEAMIEFAKLHVEAALKEASENAKCCNGAIVDLDHTIIEAYVEKDSILNAYPLKNIK
jgi:uncharacterized protein with PIN domain